MEHLQEGISHQPGLDSVPLYANLQDQGWQGDLPQPTGFHSFHNGHYGWELDEEDNLVSSSSLGLPNLAGNQWSGNHFVQRWLYFEVLREIFQDVEGYSFGSTFTRSGRDGRYTVNTEDLPEFLQKWRQKEMINPEGRVQRLIHIQQVLDRARFYASRYCSVTEYKKNLETGDTDYKALPVKWPINDLVALSILVLGETLSRALRKIQKKVSFNIKGWHSRDEGAQGWGYSKLALKLLDNSVQWSPKAIDMLRGRFRGNTIGLLCALRRQGVYKRTSQPLDHRYVLYHHGCIDNARRRGLQISECQKKGPLGLSDPDRVGKLIQAGKIPLFKYDRHSEKLQLVEMDETNVQDYAIFSHVWSDGFGNTTTNEMNRCVLQLFTDLFDSIRRQMAASADGNPNIVSELFWIDTLALPAGAKWTKERQVAISQMHRIYELAKYTIVLDRGLMEVSQDSGYAPPAMRITLSSWISRLWTLQEAVLSKKLYFNFSDRLCSMDDLETLFKDEDNWLHTCTAALGREYYHSILGHERRRRIEPDARSETKKTDAGFVSEVWKAVQWRTTSHIRHETLALAILFNLETDYFSDADGSDNLDIDEEELESRMQQLLTLLADLDGCAIHPGMIFLPGPRLSAKGFRWAPRTWLSTHQIERPDPLTLNQYEPTRLDAAGLVVKLPGFWLHELEQESNKLDLCKDIYFSIDKELHEWYRIEWADNDIFLQPADLAGRPAAVICSRPNISDEQEIALLVAAVTEKKASIIYVEIVRRIYIRRELREAQLSRCRADFLKRKTNALCYGESLLEGQLWCVDGPEQPELEHRDTLKSRDSASIKSRTGRLVEMLGLKNVSERVKRLRRSGESLDHQGSQKTRSSTSISRWNGGNVSFPPKRASTAPARDLGPGL